MAQSRVRCARILVSTHGFGFGARARLTRAARSDSGALGPSEASGNGVVYKNTINFQDVFVLRRFIQTYANAGEVSAENRTVLENALRMPSPEDLGERTSHRNCPKVRLAYGAEKIRAAWASEVSLLASVIPGSRFATQVFGCGTEKSECLQPGAPPQRFERTAHLTVGVSVLISGKGDVQLKSLRERS
jgi:hypothetical protein